MLFDNLHETPLERVHHPDCQEREVDLRILRLDKTDARISGNKWYKLKYNLLAAKDQGYKTVLSFGGAYSNHIHALAWAGHEMCLQTFGIIRGEAEYASNPTLTDAQRWGMRLQFVNRAEYRQRHDPQQIAEWVEAFPDSYKPVLVVPEGGSNALALRGCGEIIKPRHLASFSPDLIVLPCGTGGTLAGVALSQADNPKVHILGIPVLKNADFLYKDIRQLMLDAAGFASDNWSLDLQGHYGGYGKSSEALLLFLQQMQAQYALPLDQVYTGKMLLRLWQLIEQGQYRGKKILVLHTGGLQGLRSISG